MSPRDEPPICESRHLAVNVPLHSRSALELFLDAAGPADNHFQFWITTGGKLAGKPTGPFYHFDIERKISIAGSPGRIRTSDQPVNSRLLYR